jgi:hypothetical protein
MKTLPFQGWSLEHAQANDDEPADADIERRQQAAAATALRDYLDSVGVTPTQFVEALARLLAG